jgi:predicted O-linked N-acetylglucosamine transferase (SPINDLY family)
MKPGYFQALTNLGTVLKEIKQLDEAIAILRQAIALKPDYAEAFYNLGNALKEKGLLDEAVTAYRRVTALKPDFGPAHNNLGVALSDQGLLEEALISYRRAISQNADDAEANSNLGKSLKELGRFDEAIAAYRRALALRPDFVGAHSNLLLAMHHQHLDDHAIAKEHFRWQQQHAGPSSEWIESLSKVHLAGQRLRIGYVSPDFREHSVTRFLLPLMANHDREKFEIFAYAEVPAPDEITIRLQSLTDVWRDTVGLGDAEVAELIRKDGIDILVDLAGHSAGNRLLVFARRPAPVQVTWLGYPGTTGLDAMSHRLTDSHADPPGLTEGLYSESLVRLPHSAWCFSVIESPEVVPRPRRGVVFGCFNNFAKVTETMLRLWAQVLAAVPDSSLLLKSTVFAEKITCERVRGLFQTQGIATERILLKGRTPSQAEHLALYHEMDIALDTFPYHGTTTTCEAIWMGVPVVTLEGTNHRSRVGVSLLNNVGLKQLIATSPDEYVRIASSLGRDIPALEAMQRTLRERMLGSPLMDAFRFTHDIESAYQAIWNDWSEYGKSRSQT